MSVANNGGLSEARRIAQFIGLPKWEHFDDLSLVDSVKKGFPTRTVKIVVKRVDPDFRFLRPADIIPRSTLSRREKQRKPLSADDSEKIFAVAKLFSEVIRVYKGDTEKVARFLITNHPMLGNRKPLDVATESIAGAELVLKILARADAGIAA
jgi:putative toxin-antitoxin system antitoxin component (TIGR02293 family)